MKENPKTNKYLIIISKYNKAAGYSNIEQNVIAFLCICNEQLKFINMKNNTTYNIN